ncbi:sodium channel modifier 1 [Procambarus clarkii]|uniref:sodium channel modifier 1 n=1 Tax=Procambarus clarkii TaxID=6728 RepID=UPI003744675E
MSFKRETDSDSSYVEQLKERRVSELLAENIPEDEALLIKNGRYACLVCSHRPICDTLPMLSRHRAGKKHLYCLSKFMEKKTEMELLVLKHQQKNTLKIDQANNPVSTAVPQNNQSRAHQLSGMIRTSSTNNQDKKRSKLSPYSRKAKIYLNKSDGCSIGFISQRHINNVADEVTKYVNRTWQKNDFVDTVMKERCLSQMPQSTSTAPAIMDKNPPEDTSQSTGGKASTIVDSELNLKREKYYQNLRASGWKRNLLGNWTRDNEAEFDSDEEPPQEFENQLQ